LVLPLKRGCPEKPAAGYIPERHTSRIGHQVAIGKKEPPEEETELSTHLIFSLKY